MLPFCLSDATTQHPATHLCAQPLNSKSNLCNDRPSYSCTLACLLPCGPRPTIPAPCHLWMTRFLNTICAALDNICTKLAKHLQSLSCFKGKEAKLLSRVKRHAFFVKGFAIIPSLQSWNCFHYESSRKVGDVFK